jgi:uncharacterized protein (TIGR03382 family)
MSRHAIHSRAGFLAAVALLLGLAGSPAAAQYTPDDLVIEPPDPESWDGPPIPAVPDPPGSFGNWAHTNQGESGGSEFEAPIDAGLPTPSEFDWELPENSLRLGDMLALPPSGVTSPFLPVVKWPVVAAQQGDLAGSGSNSAVPGPGTLPLLAVLLWHGHRRRRR